MRVSLTFVANPTSYLLDVCHNYNGILRVDCS